MRLARTAQAPGCSRLAPRSASSRPPSSGWSRECLTARQTSIAARFDQHFSFSRTHPLMRRWSPRVHRSSAGAVTYFPELRTLKVSRARIVCTARASFALVKTSYQPSPNASARCPRPSPRDRLLSLERPPDCARSPSLRIVDASNRPRVPCTADPSSRSSAFVCARRAPRSRRADSSRCLCAAPRRPCWARRRARARAPAARGARRTRGWL